LLFELEEQRRDALAAAYRCLSAGQWQQGAAIADGIEALRTDSESCRLQAVIALLRRDFSRAWQLFPSCKVES
jgi:hypothetical protein